MLGVYYDRRTCCRPFTGLARSSFSLRNDIGFLISCLSLSFSFSLLLNYFPRGSALSCANRAKYVKVGEIRWILCNAEWMIFLGRGFLSATCGMYEDFPCPGTSFVDTFQKNIFLRRCFFYCRTYGSGIHSR